METINKPKRLPLTPEQKQRCAERARKVLIAEPGKDWLIRDWTHAVEVLPGHHFTPDDFIKSSKK